MNDDDDNNVVSRATSADTGENTSLGSSPEVSGTDSEELGDSVGLPPIEDDNGNPVELGGGNGDYGGVTADGTEDSSYE